MRGRLLYFSPPVVPASTAAGGLQFPLCLLLYGTTGQLQGKDLLGSFWLYQFNFNVLVLPVTWTLTCELYFYAIVSLSLLLPRGWRLSVFWAFFAAIVVANVWWIVNDRYTVDEFERSHFGMYLYLSPLCLEFLLATCSSASSSTCGCPHLCWRCSHSSAQWGCTTTPPAWPTSPPACSDSFTTPNAPCSPACWPVV